MRNSKKQIYAILVLVFCSCTKTTQTHTANFEVAGMRPSDAVSVAFAKLGEPSKDIPGCLVWKDEGVLIEYDADFTVTTVCGRTVRWGSQSISIGDSAQLVKERLAPLERRKSPTGKSFFVTRQPDTMGNHLSLLIEKHQTLKYEQVAYITVQSPPSRNETNESSLKKWKDRPWRKDSP